MRPEHVRVSFRVITLASLAGLGVLSVGQMLAPAVAHAGVPRACIHPSSDPIECTRQMRLERNDVLPSARVRRLKRQRVEYEQIVVPFQDAERDRLLEEILFELRELKERRP